jgi:hypothetical protein
MVRFVNAACENNLNLDAKSRVPQKKTPARRGSFSDGQPTRKGVMESKALRFTGL